MGEGTIVYPVVNGIPDWLPSGGQHSKVLTEISPAAVHLLQ